MSCHLQPSCSLCSHKSYLEERLEASLVGSVLRALRAPGKGGHSLRKGLGCGKWTALAWLFNGFTEHSSLVSFDKYFLRFFSLTLKVTDLKGQKCWLGRILWTDLKCAGMFCQVMCHSIMLKSMYLALALRIMFDTIPLKESIWSFVLAIVC